MQGSRKHTRGRLGREPQKEILEGKPDGGKDGGPNKRTESGNQQERLPIPNIRSLCYSYNHQNTLFARTLHNQLPLVVSAMERCPKVLISFDSALSLLFCQKAPGQVMVYSQLLYSGAGCTVFLKHHPIHMGLESVTRLIFTAIQHFSVVYGLTKEAVRCTTKMFNNIQINTIFKNKSLEQALLDLIQKRLEILASDVQISCHPFIQLFYCHSILPWSEGTEGLHNNVPLFISPTV